MEDRINILTVFLSLMKNDIVDYYQRSHLYLKDLVSYKNINLKTITSTETDQVFEATLIKMLKAIKTGLNTLGVSITKLTEIQNYYLIEISKGTIERNDYNSYLQHYLDEYINKILFEILIEYLLDLDIKKMEALKSFKLIPPRFVNKLKQFKEQDIISDKMKKFITLPRIEEYLNISDLSIKIETTKKNPIKFNATIMNEDKKSGKTKDKNDDEQDILKQLEAARKGSIETLKGLKTEVSKSSILKSEEANLERAYQEVGKEVKQIPAIIPKENIKTPNTEIKEQVTNVKEEIFLDYFGNLPSVDPEIINRFKIDTINLLNSRVVNPDFLDLECLFYYISIMKMVSIEFPFSSIEILEILKNYISEMAFSFSKNSTPDPISIFYGIAITKELDLIHRTKIISLQAMGELLVAEFKTFMPEKLNLNYYTLLSLKMLEKNEIISSNKDRLLYHVLGLELLNLKGLKPTLDIYNYLGFIKIMDRNLDLSNFNTPYINELKKNLNPNGSIDDLVTKSARTLLILSLLDLKNQESVLCSRLLNFIIKSTDFFSLDNLNKDFNWRINKLAYKIELRMLFWALLACTQYPIHNFLNL